MLCNNNNKIINLKYWKFFFQKHTITDISIYFEYELDSD